MSWPSLHQCSRWSSEGLPGGWRALGKEGGGAGNAMIGILNVSVDVEGGELE